MGNDSKLGTKEGKKDLALSNVVCDWGKNSLQMPSLCTGVLRAGISLLVLSVRGGVLQTSSAAIRAFTIILVKAAD